MKKLIALFLSLVILFPSSVYAEGADKLPGIDFSEMKYEEYNPDRFNERLEKVNELLNKKNTSDEIFALLDECEKEFVKAETMYCLASVNASRENTPENNEIAGTAYMTYMNMVRDFYNTLVALYNSSYKKQFKEWYGEGSEEFIDKAPSAEFYSLSEKERDLINEYMNNQFGTINIKDSDKEYSLDDILELINNEVWLSFLSDIELAKKGYTRSELGKGMELYREYLKESNATLGKIFIELRNTRDKIAKECGYDNYADYAYSEVYSREYTTEDIKDFRGYVVDYIVPLYKELTGCLARMSREAFECSEEEITEIIEKYLGNINSDMAETFRYMLKYHLIDIAASDKKVTPGTAYTLALPEYKSAYLFSSPVNDDVWQLTTTVHEFGHFNAIIHDPAYTQDMHEVQDGQNLDVSEIHSQGLELLFMEYYANIFNNPAYEKMLRIYDMLYSIISGCCYDEWQYEVYKNPDMSLDEINSLFGKISEKYGSAYGNDGSGNFGWVAVSHNFSGPMYYISYAVSAVAAMEIWEQSLSDYEGACNKYISLCEKGGFVPFADTLEECGFRDVFSEESIKSIVNSVNKAFCLEHENVDCSAWYYPAVTETIKYFDVSDYIPSDNASRGMAAEALGRLYDDEKGIEGEYVPVFSDVSSKYISWAAATGIVEGYDGDYFGAYDSLTREQAAAVIYRYAENEGADMSFSAALSLFADADSVSDWAEEAMCWAADKGVVNGREDNILAPSDKVTCAELSQMILNLKYNVLTN